MNKHLIICALILITTFFANSAKCEDNFKLSNTQNNSETDGNKSVTTSLKKFGYGYTGSDGHQEQIDQLKKRVETLEKDKPEIKKLKKQVRKLEKSDKVQNRRLTEVEKSNKDQERRIAKLEEGQIFLNVKLNEIIKDQREYYSIVTNASENPFYHNYEREILLNLEHYKLFINSETDRVRNYEFDNLIIFSVNNIYNSGLSDLVVNQIYLISEKLNKLAEKNKKYEITVTATDEDGKASEALTKAVIHEMYKQLNDQFNLSYSIQKDKVYRNHNVALISNPFCQ